MKTSKKYSFDIGNNRLLTIAKKYDQLCIEEKGSGKSATFTPSRWASFLLCLDEINTELEKFAVGENVAYRWLYGGGWCASVTSGFTCADLRSDKNNYVQQLSNQLHILRWGILF